MGEGRRELVPATMTPELVDAKSGELRQPVHDGAGTISLVSRSTGAIELGFLLLFGLALRVLAMCLIIKQHPPMWLFTRGTEMGLMATSILNGEGLSSPFGGHTGPTALIGPLYPMMVAGIFRVVGSYTLAAEIIVLAVQVLVGVINIWLVVRLADRLAGQQAAFFAGLFWACSPPLLFMPTIFWDTTFTACALTGMVLLSFEFYKKPSRKRLLYASVLFGLASLLNSALFFSSVALLVVLSAQLLHAKFKNCLFALALFAFAFSPWPIRNAFAMHAFIPFRTTIGLELWMGNHEGATGHLEEALFPLFNPGELAEYKRLGEVGYNREKTHLALDYIRKEPGAFLRLTSRRTARYWLGTGSREESRWLALHGTTTTILGFIGLTLFMRRRGAKAAMPFVLPLILFPLPYYITHAEFRYRLVVDPLLTAFAACAVVAVFQKLGQKNLTKSPKEHHSVVRQTAQVPESPLIHLVPSSELGGAS